MNCVSRMFFLGGNLCPVLFGHLNLKNLKKPKNLKSFSKKPRFFPALLLAPLIQAVLDCAAHYRFIYVCVYVCCQWPSPCELLLNAVFVTDDSNTTSQVSAHTTSTAYHSIRDDAHVALVARPCRCIHLPPLPGRVQAQ